VNGYLQDFLFPPDRARTPVRALSGGERNRLLLARLFTRSFNLLVLDEPTNDLDIDTLELLADRLLEYTGTLIVVSHDRAFLDQVVTSTLVFEGNGRIGEYAGGYSDWVRQRPAPVAVSSPTAVPKVTSPTQPNASKKRRLSFAETAELKALPDRIDRTERERDDVLSLLADPVVLRDGNAALAAHNKLTALEEELAALLSRWEALETIVAEAR
jgi:ATP-binding cassette subfamily F protein uup